MTPHKLIRHAIPVTLALALLVSGTALAQSGSGSLTGEVQDENGEPVGGFTLVLEPQDNASTLAQRIKVNKKGRFAHRFIPTARYKVVLEGADAFLESMVYVIRDGSNLQIDKIESKAHPEKGLPPIQVLTGQNGTLELTVASESYRAELRQKVGIAEASGDLKKAGDLLNSGKAEESLKVVEEILVKQPDLGAALFVKGSALSRMGRHADAEAPLREAIAAIPEQPGLAATLADVLLASGAAMHKNEAQRDQARARFAEAADLYATELERDPGNEGLIRQRVTALTFAGREDRLADALEQLIEVAPSDPEPYLKLAQAALASDDREGALAALERIPQKGREATTVMLNMAVSLYNESRYDEAKPIVARALEWDPEFAELHRLAAGLELVQGNRDAAIAGLERYLQLAAPDAPNVPAARQLLDGLKTAAGSATNQ